MGGRGTVWVSLILRVDSRPPLQARLVPPSRAQSFRMASGALAEGKGQVVLVSRSLNLTSGSPQVQIAATCWL